MKNEKILFSVEDEEESNAICDECKVNKAMVEEEGMHFCRGCFILQKQQYLKYYTTKDNLYIDYNEITPKIFLGNEDCARDENFLIKNNISNILICAEGCDAFFPDKYVYKTLYLDDISSEKLLPVLPEAIEFIDSSKNNVYVHCVMGVSRSASVVIAYLMYKEKISFKEAEDFVFKKRNRINPNTGFVSQLKIFESLLKENDYDLSKLKKIDYDEKYYNK